MRSSRSRTLFRTSGVRFAPAALAVALTAPLAAQVSPPPAEARRAIEDVAGLAAERGFSGQVLAVRDGRRLFHAGYGLADAEAGVLVDTATVFAIGSVTKQFTRVAILLLEERGALSIGDPISRHLEGVPPDKADITIAQLLDMSAGFHEYHDDSGDHQPMTRDEALRRILAQELRFEPGTDRAYSNSGYTLLAAIVESVAGVPFPEFVRRELIRPVGMGSTGFHGDDLWDRRRVARGRGPSTHGENAPDAWPPVTWALIGAGGMVSTASDLGAWIAALRGGDILGGEALAKAYPSGVDWARYAGGDDFGFVTGVIELDGGDDFVVVSSNSGTEALGLAAGVAEAMTGVPLPFDLPGPEIAVEETEPDGVPDSPRARATARLLAALEDGSDAALRELVEGGFAPAFRDAFLMEEHLAALRGMSATLRAAGDVSVTPRSPVEVVVTLGGRGAATTWVVEIESSEPHDIVGIRPEGD